MLFAWSPKKTAGIKYLTQAQKIVDDVGEILASPEAT